MDDPAPEPEPAAPDPLPPVPEEEEPAVPPPEGDAPVLSPGPRSHADIRKALATRESAAVKAVSFMHTSLGGKPETSKLRAAMPTFTKVVLYTDRDGRARFREEAVALTEGTPQARLSALMPSGGYQLRESPVGFRSEFHCTPKPQLVFIISGEMEIGLQDGSTRVFRAGEHFYSADTLPEGATFDAKVHGHWSRQRGDKPLVTLFVRS